MTEVATTEPTREVVPYTGNIAGLGLEDVSTSDLTIPRLDIVGKKAIFKNKQTGQEFSALDAVLIGQVKQRVMFHKDIDENYKRPQCRSTDFEVGFPNVDPKAPHERGFPWSEGNFDIPGGKAGLYLPEVKEKTGLPALPCASCKFKEWENKKTRCREQHVYPLNYQDPDTGLWVPAVLTVSGSGIMPSKTYAGSFKASEQPMFTVITRLTLTPASKGSVDYAIPVFTKLGGSDPGRYEEWTAAAHEMRAYLRRWPTQRDDELDEADIDNSNVGPARVPEIVPLPGQAPQMQKVIEAPAPPVAAPPAPSLPDPPVAAPPVAAPVAPPAPPVAAPVAAPVAPPAPAAPAPAAAPFGPPAPAGYEAIWDTMPDAAKQAILATIQTPAVEIPTPSAPVAPAAPADANDLPF